jgi:hypothetical protein
MEKPIGSYARDFIRQAPPDLVWEDYETTQSIFGSSAALNFHNYGIAANLVTEAKILQENGFTDYFLHGELQPDTELSPVLSSEEATAKGKDYGLTFDQPIRQSVLDLRMKKRRDELMRQSVIERSGGGFGAGAANITGGLVGALADPVNVAASFIPIVREARFARLATKMGGVGRARVVAGVVEGGVGAALLEPATLFLADRAQADYDMYDSMMNIAFGSIIGGGLHFTGGYIKDKLAGKVTQNAVPDRIAATDIETKYQALRTAFADVMEGRPVDVEPVLRADRGFKEDPFDWLDPNKWDSAKPPEASDVFIGTVSPKMSTWLNGVVGELKQSQRGERIFIEANGRGGTDEVIGVKSTAPEWFKSYNRAVTEHNKNRQKIIKKNRTLPIDKQIEVPKSQTILTKAKVISVAEKMKAGEKLHKTEKEVADVLYSEAMGMRRENAKQMVEFRQRREEDRWNEIRSYNALSRGEVTLQDVFADKSGPSALTREAKQNFPERVVVETDADTALAETMESLDSLNTYIDTMDPKAKESFNAELKLASDDVAMAEQKAKAILSLAACMGRG